MNGMIKTAVIAAALGKSRKSILERAEREGWPFVRKSGGMEWMEARLPWDVRLALADRGDNKPSPPALKLNSLIPATDSERQTSYLRANLISEWERSGLRKDEFITLYNSGALNPHLLKLLGKVSLRTFYRWEEHLKKTGLDGLVPRYSASSGGAGESLSDSDKALLQRFWLRDSRPTIAHAYKLLLENYPGTNCTYQTALRYLRSLPQALADYHRLGRTAFTNKHQPYMDQNIWQYKSLDVVVSDHHCLDCIVMHQGKLIRPWITTMQDYRSGKILGWCPSVSPSSLSIIVAYYMMVIQYGIPRKMLFDNGKDYRSEILNGKIKNAKVCTPEKLDAEQEIYIQGLFYMIGSEVSFTLPYNAKSKGRQERFFGILKEYYSKDIGSFIGGDTRERSEDTELYFRSINGMAKRNDVPLWEPAINALGAVITYINDKLTSDGKGMNGKTRSQVFDENLPADVRHADREALQLALTKGDLRIVRNNVIKIGANLYYHPDLIEFSGQQVMVRTMLLTDAEVQICDLSGRYLFTATANYLFEGDDLAAATKRLRGAQKRNLQRLAEMGTGEVQAAPEYDTMVQVASNKYRQGKPFDLNKYLSPPEEDALPLAAGAEDLSINNEPLAQNKPIRILKNPLDANWEDYYELTDQRKT
ncbi:MAG: Mu transposase C-terminal domain-containing protein [Treponema sp.]|nr:Mu transposase C-terminal domain-containing protein [Treponema sp.]